MKVTATIEELAAAFTEWDRRWRKEPERFEADCVRVLQGRSCESYGENCAPYLVEILADLA